MRYLVLSLILSCLMIQAADAPSPFETQKSLVTDSELASLAKEQAASKFGGSPIAAYNAAKVLEKKLTDGDPTTWAEEDWTERYRLAQAINKAIDRRRENECLASHEVKWLAASKTDKEFIQRVMFTTTGPMNFGKKAIVDSNTAKMRAMKDDAVWAGIGDWYVKSIHQYLVAQDRDNPADHILLAKAVKSVGINNPQITALLKAK